MNEPELKLKIVKLNLHIDKQQGIIADLLDACKSIGDSYDENSWVHVELENAITKAETN